MCGILGYLSTSPIRPNAELLSRSLDMMHHRGPDGRGLLLIDDAGPVTHIKGARFQSELQIRGAHHIAMGHVRFSLVDLSARGDQPYVTEDGKVGVSLNGEIYNYVEVRDTLKARGYRFASDSDTEVLAKAYQCWGTDCFERFSGFWALSLYDFEKKKLLLSRDPLGKAPIYVCRTDQGLFWASELKVLLNFVPEERGRINTQAVAHFANWIKKDFGNSTLYDRIKTFPGGSYAWINADGTFEPQQHWTLPQTRRRASDLPVGDAVEEFHSLMTEAVRIRKRADVPVAVQLSGGMDSSTVLAKAAAQSDRVEAFTIKYGYGPQDEEPYARAVAERYKGIVNYNVVHPDEDDFSQMLGAFAYAMDEPYHSPNQISSQRIWRQMADKGMRAVLYGGGGDEVFSGYVSEYYAPYLNSLLRRGKLGRFATEFFGCKEYKPGFSPKDYAMMLAKMVPATPRKSTFGKVRFIPKDINPLDPGLIAMIDRTPPSDYDDRMLANMRDWRMNYWLRIDNQNSMGVPIELRSPFLDKSIVEYAFTLPREYLIRDGWLKWIVRKAMEHDLPDNVVWRREKMGFPFPLKDWLLKNKRALAALYTCECPYVSAAKLTQSYEALVASDAEYAWAMMSILMWWRFCVVEPQGQLALAAQ